MKTVIRKIGNSSGAILPAAILKKLNLVEGAEVDVQEEGAHIVIKPYQARAKYILADLLKQCDENAPLPDDLEQWDKAPVVGREIL